MEDCYTDERGASARLRLSVSTLQKMRVAGNGPQFCKIGKAVRYRVSDLDAYMTARIVSSTSERVAA